MRPNLVFTGPTLSHLEVLKIADVVCLPPVVQGSVVAAVQQFDPAAIVIIDGGFQSEPAVRHKEILWAISQGIPVIGAASMGALRAAELHPYMQGAGLIFRWYRRFAFAPDDAVAVLHGPWELNFSPLTHPLVDLRRTFRNASRRKVISEELAKKLEDAARALNFRDRKLGSVIRDALPIANIEEIEAHKVTLAKAFVQQKKKDALFAIQLLRDKPLELVPLPLFKLTAAFLQDLEDSGLSI